ncbi:MAG: hypothetical protein ACKO96_39645, partial [Flammeovirgaceae bacterium]
KRNAVSVVFIFKILSFTNSLNFKNCRLVASKIAHNGFGLCVRAGFVAQNCQYTTKVDAR